MTSDLPLDGILVVDLCQFLSGPYASLRLQDLGVTDIYLGAADKFEAYQEFKEPYELETDGMTYMGDDIPDYQIMRKVGLPCCPGNAVPEIKEISLYISPYQGGDGCARDVIEKVLRLHGKWRPE